MGINKVILLGNLGKDPELRVTSNQTPVCNFSLATGERRKDAAGNWIDHTEWHNIVTYGKTAENCAQYLKKGRQVYVEGRIQTRKWQDKEGKDRYTTEIIAMNVQFIGGGRGEAASNSYSNADEAAGKNFVSSLKSADEMASGGALAANGGAPASGAVPFEDDDIPF